MERISIVVWAAGRPSASGSFFEGIQSSNEGQGRPYSSDRDLWLWMIAALGLALCDFESDFQLRISLPVGLTDFFLLR